MAQWKPSESAIIILQDQCPNVSKERLTIKDLRFVVKALKTLSSKWEEIGMTANIIDLDQIKIEHRGLYKRLIAVVNSWLSGNYYKEGDGSNAPSWWKIVDIVADDIGGGYPNLALSIAKNWKELGKDQFSTLAQSSSKTPLSCGMDGSKKLITIIVKALNGVASKWFEIAVLFGIPVNKLNAIKDECDCSTEACLKKMITEWLSGRYNEASGCPTPSVCVLVDAVEHQVGGSNPALAKELTMLKFDAPNPTEDSIIAPSGLQGNSSQLHQPLAIAWNSEQTQNAVMQTSAKRDETAGLNPTATENTDAQLVKDFPAVSPEAATIQPEVPKYSLKHDALEEALPRPPDGSPELKALQKFAAEVVIILHTTVSPSEMPAVLKDMTAPELGLQLDGPINLLSVPNTIILGMFGGYKCAIVQTEQGQKCKKEIESALDKHLQNTRFVIALGMAYCIPKYKFGDVLVSKTIRTVINPRMEEACIKPRSSEYDSVPVLDYLSKTFGRNLHSWRDFECSKTGRVSNVYAGDIVSVPWLVADETTRNKLLVHFPDAIGGEMEGFELVQIQKDYNKKYHPRQLGVIIIKGAADHADKDKKAGKLWQYTAARAAVCFTKFKLERTNGCLFADVPEA